MSDMSVAGFHDRQFKIQVKWDVPLLGGYRHTVLGRLGNAHVTPLLRPLVMGLHGTLRRARLDALWLHGYKHQVQLRAIPRRGGWVFRSWFAETRMHKTDAKRQDF